MKENIPAEKILNKITYVFNLALAFLITLFFLPTTIEFYEFNKLMLISVTTLVLLILTSVKLLLNQKTNISKSRLDAGIMVFLLSMVLATLFSVDKNLSIFGSEGRWFPSLLGFLVFAVYFYIATTTLNEQSAVKRIVYALIFGIATSTLITILSFYGIHLFNIEGLKSASFTTVGSLNAALIVASIGFVLSVSSLLVENKLANKIALTLTAVSTGGYLSVINNELSWIALALSAVIVLRLFFSQIFVKKQNLSYLLVVLGVMSALAITALIPQTRNVLYNSGYPKEITLNINQSWEVAASTLKQRPIFGTGLGTFELNFNRFKPQSLNNTAFWNVSFDKPQNEVFNVLTTMGLVGFVAMIFLGSKIYGITTKAINTTDDSGLSKVLAAGALIAAASFVYSYATIVVTFIMFLLLSALIAEYRNLNGKETETFSLEFTSIANITSVDGDTTIIKGSYVKYIAAVPLVALAVYASLLFYKTYAAETYMRMAQIALQNGDGLKVYEYQGKAINLNPRRASYHREYAKTNLLLANSLASKENLTDLDKQNIQNLISEAGNRAKILTENVGPLSAANWETRGAIYRTLEKVAENALQWSAAAYETAVQLSPANPMLRVNLGGVYSAMGNELAAANQFKVAANLKPDYANARYNLAKSLIALNEYALAKDELTAIKKLMPADAADQKLVDTDLALVEEQLKKADVAGAKDDRTTIEDLQKTDAKPTTQEPLTNAGQEEPIKADNLDQKAIPQQ